MLVVFVCCCSFFTLGDHLGSSADDCWVLKGVLLIVAPMAVGYVWLLLASIVIMLLLTVVSYGLLVLVRTGGWWLWVMVGTLVAESTIISV